MSADTKKNELQKAVNLGLWRSILIHLICCAPLFIAMPFFFRWLHNREGFQLYDPLLELLPAADVSIPIGIIMYGTVIFSLWNSRKNIPLLLLAVRAYTIMQALRMLSLTLIPLAPPADCVYLMDPLVHYGFYSGQNLTTDLFFSGHMATILLMYKLSRKKIILVLSVILGVLLLVQHIHYTIDLLVAPIVVGLCWNWAGRLK